MTAFALLGHLATDPASAEIREVLRAHGTIDNDHPDVIVADLEPGQRAVPDDVLRLAQHAKARLILLSREPTIRPVVVVRPDLIVVQPGRRNLDAALALLLDEPTELATNRLGRSWWTASVRGASGLPLQIAADDSDGVTVVVGSDDRTVAVRAASTIRESRTDARREAKLRDAVGPAAVLVHLAPNNDHWLIMWTSEFPLWIASPSRIPARWCLSASLAAASVSFSRIPAFPGDCLVATHLDDLGVVDVYEQLSVGSYETYVALRRLVRAPETWGFLVEAR